MAPNWPEAVSQPAAGNTAFAAAGLAVTFTDKCEANQGEKPDRRAARWGRHAIAG
jgi:hypothetical protein